MLNVSAAGSGDIPARPPGDGQPEPTDCLAALTGNPIFIVGAFMERLELLAVLVNIQPNRIHSIHSFVALYQSGSATR